jgi:AdoMet-dependent heme synthase
VSERPFPVAPMMAFDTLWMQVGGTVCNLQCTHCFISCSPVNHAHEPMSLASVRPYLAEAEALGVRDYYLTGGEPFLNPEILPILETILRQGPATVLTNGLFFREETARRLRELADGSEYSLDLRVSLDGHDAATNDAIRGEGTFERAMQGLRRLAAHGMAPILTVTEACDEAASAAGRARLLQTLADAGLPHPRLKIMPLLRMGAETARTRGYDGTETLRGSDLTAAQAWDLACASGRMVTSRGVFVCPILIDEPAARLGDSLAPTLRPFTLAHGGCYTCVTLGLSCRT